MTTYVLGLHEIDRSMVPLAGGKGANLGELARIEGIRVPDGFCVTTDAFDEVLRGQRGTDGLIDGSIDRLIDELSGFDAASRAVLGETSARLRDAIERAPVPDDVIAQVAAALAALGEGTPVAVRSSATAEDLPTASFAGQQDTYLNILGADEVLRHVRRCWASLFTERAVTYRAQNGFDHRKARLAVVVQRMVFPQVAGILFTADPITSNRKVSSIDASFGLGEALVSGLVNADNYRVRDGAIVERTIATKKLAISPHEGGGTKRREIEKGLQTRQALTDEHIVALERIGRRIEEHFGQPQDIEWCCVDGVFSIVQSRPITTLYPLPEQTGDAPHVYISVGHQQMMTDAMKPLGISVWLLTTPAPMRVAGGRLFVDVAPMLASPAAKRVIDTLGQDPLIKAALATVMERRFVPMAPPAAAPPKTNAAWFGEPPPMENDPAIVPRLVERKQASIEAMKRAIATKSGPELFDFILADIEEMKRLNAEPESATVIRIAMIAHDWLNENIKQWLGETNVADTLTQSVPNNVTSEMGLALLDVADAIRPHPQVIEYLKTADDATFFDGLARVEGGAQARDAIAAYLDKYGMRASGEIDVTRPRWAEAPTMLVPLLLGNVKAFEPGESRRKFERGAREAREKEQQLLERLRQLPDGAQKAEETEKMIGLLRTYIGHREYPKYSMVQRWFAYRLALLREAAQLVRDRVIRTVEDIYFLTFAELQEVVRTRTLDLAIVDARREAHAHHEKLAPPRVMTSEGEILTGAYKREDLPAGALVGIPVSTGVIEGRARVIARMEDAALEDGDILVTAFTDPSWTPLFVSIKGLVTEVGSLMTHGAVIAREYGLPAVVSVENATRRIRDGQRIRVNGTDGYVELLPS